MLWTYYTVEWPAAGELCRTFCKSLEEARELEGELQRQHVPEAEIEVWGHRVPRDEVAMLAALNQAAGRTSEDPPGEHWPC